MVSVMAWRFFLLLLLEVCLAPAVESKVTLEDNRYKDLVVGLDPNASPPSPADQQKILQDIKTLFTETSAAVITATEQRAYFGSITIVVPHSWQQTVAEGDASGGETWAKADVRVVEGEGSTQAPSSVEGGLCGVAGVRMEVPKAFLTQADVQQLYGEPGKVMTQEWLKYRYGVYEEHGYPGDEVFPHAFLDVMNGEARPTGCTNQQELQGSWVNRTGSHCDPLVTGATTADAECRFRIEGTTSDFSMMFITHVNQVTRLCSDETHDPLAPTRHNRLCRGASVWQVLNRHPDFNDNNNPPAEGAVSTTPSFRVVRSLTPALFVLVDHNCGENDDVCEGLTVYNDLRLTLRDVLLRGDILMAGIARHRLNMGNDLLAIYQRKVLQPVSEIDIDDFVNFLPLSEKRDSVTDPENALVSVLQKLAESDYVGGVNILMVQMVKTEEEGDQYADYLPPTVRVTAVLYGYDAFNPWLHNLTQVTDGDLFFSRTYDPYVAQQALLSLMSDNTLVTVTQRQVSLEADALVNVYIDPTVGVSTNFTVKFSQGGGSFRVTSPTGEETTINSDPFTHVEPDAKEGLWRMVVSNEANQGTGEVQVTTFGRPGQERVEVNTWTSAPSQGDLDLQTSCLAFYVSVKQGRKAVKDLALTITFYSGSSSSSRVEVALWDDGYGDPDVQLEDGIYSGYVTDFGIQADVYQTRLYADLTISHIASPPNTRHFATHARGARVLPQDPFVVEPCCGSVSSSSAIALPLSRHFASVTSLTVVNGPADQPYDPPPSCVSQLIVTKVEQDGPQVEAGTVLLDLQWTAPGKDLTTGTVTSYEIWYSSSLDDIMANFESCLLVEGDQYLNDPPIPLPYGSLQETTIALPKIVNESTQYFVVIVGVDIAQKGTPSLPVSVMVTKGVDFTTIATTTATTTAATTTTGTTTTTNPATTTTTAATTTTGTTTTTTAATTIATAATTTTTPATTTTTAATTTTTTGTTTTTNPGTTTTTAATTTTSAATTTTTAGTTTTTSPGTTATTEFNPSTTENDNSVETDSTEYSTTSEPTDPPNSPDFVGSVGFWVLIGVSSTAVVAIAGLVLYRIFQGKAATQNLAVTRSQPNGHKAPDETVASAEEGKVSTANSIEEATDGVSKSTENNERAATAESPSQKMEVINEAFEED